MDENPQVISKKKKNSIADFIYNHKCLFTVLQACIIITSFSFLFKTESYYLPYLLIVIAAFLCMASNYKQRSIFSSAHVVSQIIFSILFSLMITYANYNIWSSISLFSQHSLNILIGIILNLIIWLGVFFAFNHILFWISNHAQDLTWKTASAQVKPLSVFLITFGIIAAIDLIIFFACKYPGILSPDSLDQVQQTITGEYSNHHPICHTLIIKLCIDVGMALFRDMNAAVAVYSVFSILLMSATFAFSVATVAEMKVPRWILILLVCFYAFMPYHILYSMTMWKDVLYGACILQFAVFFLRCEYNFTLPHFNLIGLFLSALGICLFRSNGLFSFIITLICFLCLWKYKKHKILFIMLGVLICSLIVKYPILRSLNINQPSIVEYLSIPEQQMALDIIENDDFTPEQISLLGKIIDVEQVPEKYLSYISDPIKSLISQDASNVSYLKSHLLEFGQLYISRFIKHPFTYLKGWIEQTKGYWNSGYTYPRWNVSVFVNDLGIKTVVNFQPINYLFYAYYGAFQNIPITQLFLSIGFFNWVLMLGLYTSIVRRDKSGIMACVPTLATALSLLISTPVFAEFRYDYAVFCVLPISLLFVLRPNFIASTGIFNGK